MVLYIDVHTYLWEAMSHFLKNILLFNSIICTLFNSGILKFACYSFTQMLRMWFYNIEGDELAPTIGGLVRVEVEASYMKKVEHVVSIT